jgi:hypothetical protein
MNRAMHVEQVSVRRHRNILWENLKGKYHFGNLDVNGRIILLPPVKKQDVRAWTGLSWLRTDSGGMFF